MMPMARSIWAGVRSAGTCSRPLPLQTMYRAHLLLSPWQYFFFIMADMAGIFAILMRRYKEEFRPAGIRPDAEIGDLTALLRLMTKA